MKEIKSIIVAILFTILIPVTLIAQSDNFDLVKPELVDVSSDSLKKMNAHFHRLVDEKQLAGIQTAILRKGKLIQFDSYGFSDIEENRLLNEQSIFRIFSMTKPIVSVALMQLFEEDKFKLTDPLYKFIPEFKEMFVYSDTTLIPVQQPIRIVDLLTHTSGFNYGRTRNSALNQFYYNANLNTSKTNKEFVEKLSKLPLQFEPGTNWQYGLSTNICGYLIEVLSGKSLDVYLKENIFTPLGMNDTHFQLPKEKINRFGAGYRWQEETGLVVVENSRDNRFVQEVTLMNAGGGLVSTTYDYLRFCGMLLNKGQYNNIQILKPKTIDLMLTDHLEGVRKYHERIRLPRGEAGFGLGFAIRGNSIDALQQVYGWGGAAGTYFKIDLEHELAYILMIQLSPYRHLNLRQLYQDYINSALIK
ncbi:serine hydrolase [Aquimarina sp. AU474]|uniref:serine hydrolase domain-containing protein n=1 Tax=Aquimarina sp. AU474 TaxID=2108529 RepID=UPI000D69AF81|nr:serine hydrolase domain-containing protein [Aquimarina sp. AU474]